MESLILSDWHRFTGLELRLAVEALEALLQEDQPIYRQMLAEECERVGQLFSEMQRRANGWIAKALLAWELKLLHYRSPESTHLSRKGRNGIWFLLHRGQFHARLPLRASAPLSTGVLCVRGTPGQPC
jgi:hypothetical protein